MAALVSQPAGTLIDRVIIVVDKTVVTESELFTEARIALISREGRAGLRLANEALNAELVAPIRDYLVNQLLIAAHVQRLGNIEVSDQQTNRVLQQFIKNFDSRAAYEAFKRRFDISEATVKAILRRDLRNKIYVDRRLRSWRAGRPGGPGGDNFDPETASRQGAEQLQNWLADLRNNTEIRLPALGLSPGAGAIRGTAR